MPTVLLKTPDLRPGMMTAGAVWRHEKLIIQQNTVLTGNIIRRLSTWGVGAVRVKREVRPITDNEPLTESIQVQLREEDPIFYEKYRSATNLAGKIFGYMRQHEDLPYNDLRKLASVNLYDLLQGKNVLGKLYQLKPFADYTFLHAVDVGILSGLIGLWAGWGIEKIKLLTLCGVMHDIGKSQIPLTLLDKPGRLTATERQTINLHPQYGYYMTTSSRGILPEVQLAILQHHERENGSGYPVGLVGPKIHPFAKVVGIADTYDALTTDKVYQKSVTPFAAMEVLLDSMLVTLDKELCKIFIRNVLQSLIGATVLLSDGNQAEVLELRDFMSTKPVVLTADHQILDLNLVPSLSVVEVLKFRA
ncbi:MAG: HD-GYP domain-containing protein [Negativicutes bacterium]|nr:HD-GYP domain-containing protein [Negativicutes bacterium]